MQYVGVVAENCIRTIKILNIVFFFLLIEFYAIEKYNYLSKQLKIALEPSLFLITIDSRHF